MPSRVRPARRPRWRRYVPGLALGLVSLVPLAAPDGWLASLQILGWGPTGARILLAAAAVPLAMLAAVLANRSPVPVLVVGTFAVSLGGNLSTGPWVAAPLLAAGLGWVVFSEGRRLFEGVTLSPEGVTIHRPIRQPLTIDHDAIRAVHTSVGSTDAGTLILETDHGTVTAPALPGCEGLQARIEARMQRVPIRATADSLQTARKRVESILAGEGSTA